MHRNSFSDLVGTQPPNVILALASADIQQRQQQALPSSPSTSISSSPTNSSIITTNSAVPEKTRWSCHKDILKSSSNYFDAIFNNQFQEAEASIVFLPRGIFSSSVLDDVLYFMYTKSIQRQTTATKDDDRNLEVLEQLQSIYMAADYLGMDSLCSTIHQEIIQLTHGLVCYCHSCTLLIPHLLSFTGPNQQNDPRLSKLTQLILKLLISDPEKTLPTFWCSPTMACLLTTGAEMESLHIYLQERLLEQVNKNNAIETVHGCFLAEVLLKEKDQVQQQQEEEQDDWWSPLVCTHKRIQQAGSKLLADHFDFYCTKYPKLLSCVDGITYSFEFLDYLLSSVLNDHMNEMNACYLYKGIVRSLIIRDIVQQRSLVKQILQNAKNKTIRYIATHLIVMKELETIDKTVIEQLAQDLVVPINTLLDDDSTTKQRSLKRPPSTLSNNSTDHYYHQSSNKKSNKTPWNIKLRSRVCTMIFGQATLKFKIGQRVKLLNRPVLTMGTIQYVGKLSSAEEEVIAAEPAEKRKIISSIRNDHYLGVELDRSVGSNDGSMDGKRYFTTLPNRGIFVKPSDVTLT